MKAKLHKCHECRHALVKISINIETKKITPTASFCRYLLWKNTESSDVPEHFRCSEFEQDIEYTTTSVLASILYQIKSKYGMDVINLLLNHETPLESK
jgi:hypothetical protein